ncbi:MFS transporter [Roseivirga echinicomitans]|uniref:MFS transporter n=1 Tax=Roseivirga echinicomitans TaxID=296218 RepID=A0A150X2S4_9BACT|nr:MFS transporter [Roseivirga echinicomitans]KYG73013.1 MFS transporter [Roseivirga echinicomitans]
MTLQVPKRVLPTIVFAQFAGTSLWFAGNAILKELQLEWQLPADALATVTSSVQLGFILGTFIFALLSIADRFRPSLVFLACALLGSALNVSLIFLPPSYFFLLSARFFTGIFIAGIYPVGMKIASDWFEGKLGKALGYLVGALVLGSAFPHLLNYTGSSLSWKFVLIGTSILAVLGGLAMVFFVGEGPHRRRGAKFNPAKIFEVFKVHEFRSAAFGYFGHMWELYTFWAFLPVVLVYYNETHSTSLHPSLYTFIIMAVGAISCVLGGFISVKKGSAKVAFTFLLISGILCLISPLFFNLSEPIFVTVLLVWGFAVIGDSAQFSSLTVQTAPKESVGTAITIVVSIGFLLTIPSIQLLGYLATVIDTKWLLFTLFIGPLFGLIHTWKLVKKNMSKA